MLSKWRNQGSGSFLNTVQQIADLNSLKCMYLLPLFTLSKTMHNQFEITSRVSAEFHGEVLRIAFKFQHKI